MGGLDWKVLMHILDLSETNITFFLDIGSIGTCEYLHTYIPSAAF